MNTEMLGGLSRRVRGVFAALAVVLLVVGGLVMASDPAVAQTEIAQGGGMGGDGPSVVTPPANGMRRGEVNFVALAGGTVHVAPGKVIERGIVLIRGDRIIDVIEMKGEERPRLPVAARVVDCAGLHVYPAFLDAYVEASTPAISRELEGAHWSRMVMPQRSVLEGSLLGEREASALRKLGFGAAGVSPVNEGAGGERGEDEEDDAGPRRGGGSGVALRSGGIFRGRGAVISLAKAPSDPSERTSAVYKEKTYQAAALETTRGRGGEVDAWWSSYPGSQMGAIALMRQVFSDAAWVGESRAAGWTGGVSGSESALDALGDSTVPMLFVAEDELETLRLAKIGAEFGRRGMLLGSGMEFRRLAAVKEAVEMLGKDGAGGTIGGIVVPVSFPEAPDVSSVTAAERVELKELMTWEQAPTNPRRLLEAGVPIALTTARGRTGAFRANVEKAIRHGLPAEEAIKALTVTPAAMLGVSDQLGTIETGKRANVLVVSGELFGEAEKDRLALADAKEGGKASAESGKASAEIAEGSEGAQRKAGKGEEEAGEKKGVGTGDVKGDEEREGDEEKKDEAWEIRTVFVDGMPHVMQEEKVELDGVWEVEVVGAPPADRWWVFEDGSLKVHRAERGAEGAKGEEKSVKAGKLVVERDRISFAYDHEPLDGQKGVFSVSGVIEKDAGGKPARIVGFSVRPDGKRSAVTATRRAKGWMGFAGSWAGMWPAFAGARAEANEGQAAGAQAMRGPVLVFDEKDGLVFRDGTSQGVLKDWVVRDLTRRGDEIRATLVLPEGERAMRVTVAGDRMDGEVGGGEKPFVFFADRRSVTPWVGTWRVTETDGVVREWDALDGVTLEITPKGDGVRVVATFKKPKPEADKDGVKGVEVVEVECTDVVVDEATMSISFLQPMEKLGGTGATKDRVKIEFGVTEDDDVLVGSSELPGGGTHAYKAKRAKPQVKDGGKKSDEARERELEFVRAVPEELGLPFGAYMRMDAPFRKGGSVAVVNATIWTSNAAGEVIEGGTLVVTDGKIVAVGKGVAVPAGATVIDAAGKHVTAGLIDCHSHTGISKGVNEGGQAVTAEVRVQDVTNPDSMNWYRQLAGGLTTVNSLHGSANAIGGQNAVNKIRWGVAHPDEMHVRGRATYGDQNPMMEAATVTGTRKGSFRSGIKFALGENPKGSNWSGGNVRTRYPQTRMGVETLIRDRFEAARQYAAEWEAWVALDAAGREEKMKEGKMPRRDLELEALAEVLRGDRLVHAHSYRQDEILMLCRVAGDFGFKIGTFQHILEGYKVADEIEKHARGASAFSDWWAYKVEVQDAIPQGGPIMTEVGVNVSYNSDSDEMARRLNTEAAKAVKYGDPKRMSKAEALKYVTINPAVQLAIDGMVGSLEAGKDGDFVIWSGEPLSSLSRCEATYIEGTLAFSLEEDAKLRAQNTEHRMRIVQRLLADVRERASGGGRGGRGGRSGRGGGDGEGPEDMVDAPKGRKPTGAEGDEDEAWARERQDAFMEMLRSGVVPEDARAGECGCGWH